MRNPAGELRKATFQKLAGTLPLDALMYDTFVLDDRPFPRVVIEQTTGGGSVFTKCGWGGDWFQNIKVSSCFRNGFTQNDNDRIIDFILRGLCDFNGPYPLTDNFNIWNVQGSVIGVLAYSDGVDKYIDTNIQIKYSITQNDKT